jgi:hypothetical protein
MGKILWFPTLTALGLLATPAGLGAEAREGADGSWASEFSVAKRDVAANGRNPYFVLEPGYKLVLEGIDGQATIAVKEEIRTIEGVETRVVETCETQGEELIEICRTYFAVNQTTNDVLCFGQDVDIYLGGRVIAHDGAWRAGVGGARFGLTLQGRPRLHAKHYQEVAPGVAMTRAEVVELDATVVTPVGEFTRCLHTIETTPLRRAQVVHKWYARGIGLVRRDGLTLVKYGQMV